MFGHEYVRLAAWAKAYKFDVAWTRKEEEVTVTSKWSKLVFTVDSCMAEINGVNVCLSFAIARRAGEAYITPLDLKSTIHPLLFMPTRGKNEKVKVICIDPGHGGKDPGFLQGKQQEKKCTLLFAEELMKNLQDAHFKVMLTRTNDVYKELNDRPEYAHKMKADLFISLHFNSVNDTSVRGTETYCMTPAFAASTNSRGEGTSSGPYPGNRFDDRNILLAWNVQKHLIKDLKSEDRYVKRARFAVLRFADMPAILIESGFLSHPQEQKDILSPAWRTKAAKAIVAGIQAYKKLVEQPEE